MLQNFLFPNIPGRSLQMDGNWFGTMNLNVFTGSDGVVFSACMERTATRAGDTRRKRRTERRHGAALAQVGLNRQ
jgi:hypothetical protein